MVFAALSLCAGATDNTAEVTRYTAALESCGTCANLPTILNNLGSAYYAAGRYSEAAPLYQRALGLRETQAGSAALELLPSLNNLALLYRETADYGRARAAAERAVSIAELHQSESAETAASYANLGAILAVQGEIAEAKKTLTHALELREKLLGPNHPLVAETLSDLALAHQRAGQLRQSAAMLRRALSIYASADGPRGGLPAVLNNLGRVQVEQGHLKDAERLFYQAVTESEQQFGPHHPNVAAANANLANVLGLRRKYREAEALLHQAEEIDRRSFAPGHPRIAYDLSMEASLLYDRKKYAEAEMLLNETLAILGKNFPSTHQEIGKATAGLAEVYLQQHRLEEATSAFEKALAILEPAWGSDSPLLVPMLEHYAFALRARQDYANAARMDSRVMKIRVTQTLRGAA